MGKTEKCLLMVEQAVLEDQGMKKRMKKRMRMGVGCRLLGIPEREERSIHISGWGRAGNDRLILLRGLPSETKSPTYATLICPHSQRSSLTTISKKTFFFIPRLLLCFMFLYGP